MNTYCRYRAVNIIIKTSGTLPVNAVLTETSKCNLIFSRIKPWKPSLQKKVAMGNTKALLQIRRYCHGTSTNQKLIRSSPPWRILFFGSDEFSIFTLKSINENRLQQQDRVIESLEVVTKGHCPVRRYATDAGLKIDSWPIETPVDRYDLGVVVSFGHLLPSRIIRSFPYGVLNVHPSLLPRWRGAAPLAHTILNGDTETGVSITAVRPKHFDIGPVFMQEKVQVPKNCTTSQLRDLLGPIGANMLLKSLISLQTLEKQEISQPQQNITYAGKIIPEMTWVDWEYQTRDDIGRQYRAFHHILPLKSHFGDITIKLLNMVDITDELDESILYLHGDTHMNLPPGTPCFGRKSQICWIKCMDGWVGFRNFVIKKEITAKSFNNGYLKNSMFKDYSFCHPSKSHCKNTGVIL